MERALIGILAALAALYAFHRLALWMERRGWLYYVNSRDRFAGRGSLLDGVAAAVDPTVRHLIEAQRAFEVVEEEGIGGPDPPEPGIAIVPYDPEWPAAFARERDAITAALGDLAVRIDHNGSTAVPGLAAKPVIDIQISVHSLRPLEAYGRCLERLGYVHVPHRDDAFAPFFHRPAVWPHTHHVHVVVSGGPEEAPTLAFRDYLRAHPETARAYAELKRDLAARHVGADAASREAYAEAKTRFVSDVTERALAEGLPREP
jgi:GrpB-like predicted nucleotidyltransferase (UPF0157 family)